MYRDDDDNGNLDQLPSDWALSPELIAEMVRDLEDIRRNEVAVTEADLIAMEQAQQVKRGAFCFTPAELAIIEDARERRNAKPAERLGKAVAM